MNDEAAQNAGAEFAQQKVHSNMRQFKRKYFIFDHVEQRLISASIFLGFLFTAVVRGWWLERQTRRHIEIAGETKRALGIFRMLGVYKTTDDRRSTSDNGFDFGVDFGYASRAVRNSSVRR